MLSGEPTGRAWNHLNSASVVFRVALSASLAWSPVAMAASMARFADP
jgi:hypothetical protein